MGDILFLAHRLPWPPDRGDRIRSWHILKRLARLAPVHVVAPLDRDADRAGLTEVGAVAASVHTARRGGPLPAILRAIRRGTPASVEAFVVPALERAVGEILNSRDIATVFAYSGQMAHYVPRNGHAQRDKRRFIMDFVDMDSAKFAALGGFANKQEAKRLLAWEIATAQRADAALFVSTAEAGLFTAKTGLPAQVIENGVDAEHFSPDAVVLAEAPHPLIVFTGQMDYRPNIDAVTAFVRTTLPLVDGASFAIVGRNPTVEVRTLASDRVIVTGEVPDTRPWLAAADVVVAPLLLARGIQNKVLEAMAMARPVVLSGCAAEGIDARDGVEFAIADSAEKTAALIATLLADASWRRDMGAAARARVIARYGWDARLAPLDDLIAIR